MRANDKQIYELTAHVNTLSDTVDALLRQLSQSSPSVSGKASALVALAKDARMDGRIGAGDVTVSVMLAGGGFSIGVIGAAGVWLGGVDFISTGEMLGFCTLSGCALGILRTSIDALAIPVMLSSLMDWLEDRWHEWLEHQKELAASKPTEPKPLVLYSYDAESDDKPTPTGDYNSDFGERHSITIREETDRSEAITWKYSRLWYFIEDCFRTGKWSRRDVCARWNDEFGEGTISQSEHKAIYDFIQAKAPGLWGLKGERNRPTLEAFLKRFRWSQTTNQATNQATSQANQE